MRFELKLNTIRKMGFELKLSPIRKKALELKLKPKVWLRILTSSDPPYMEKIKVTKTKIFSFPSHPPSKG